MQPRLAALALLALVAASAPAAAQETSAEIARRGLLADSDRAREAGDHARSLDLARRAGDIRMTPSVRLLIAQEHAALGHALDALDAAGRCVREATADAALNNRERILANCEALSATLRARVGNVVVRVPSPAPEGLRVTVQGTDVPSALWGFPYPVDPGEVTVDASSRAGAFHRALRVEAGANEEVSVALAPAALASTAPPPPATRASGPGAGPWVVAGLGVAALAASGGFYALYADAISERDAACGAAGCDPVARDADARAGTWRVLNNVSLGVGAAAVVGGVVWWLVARGRRAEAPRASWGVGPIADRGLALTVGGAL